MSDDMHKAYDESLDEPSDLTQSIRKLSVPVETEDDVFDEQGGTALLISKDKDARKWGARWLNQAGLQTTVASDPANALQITQQSMPDLVFVDAGLLGADGKPVYTTLLGDRSPAPTVFVLCASNRDVAGALDAGAYDVVRKPMDWRAISHRAKTALDVRHKQASLDSTKEALQEALAVADTARARLRSHESIEPVTGLPNKTKFVDLLNRAMHAVDRDESTLAVLVIGFTRFRLVIEAMGQEQADRILGEIGRRIGTCLQESPSSFDGPSAGLRTAAIAVLDAFRFGVMVTRAKGDETLGVLHHQLFDAVASPIQIGGQTVHLSACLGVAFYPQDADDVDSLLQRADNAMRDAQSRGGGFKYYCSETDAAAARKLRIEHMLHEALDRDELTLAYQPIVDVATGETISAEALLRWQQPDGSSIDPEEFVAVAEESGLMVRLGEFALDRACAQLAEWQHDGVGLASVCVNVAKVQLMSIGFAQTVADTIARHGIEPGNLELEISERGVLSGDYDVIEQLHAVKRLGVRLSVDDFGTGNSAIAYLKDLPIDALKVDRSYVAGMTRDDKDAAIASAMVALGQRLKLVVIAEGVETEAQLEALRELGCNAYQGFLAARPVSAAEFVTQITKTSALSD